jgi:hypothetical protein
VQGRRPPEYGAAKFYNPWQEAIMVEIFVGALALAAAVALLIPKEIQLRVTGKKS